MPKYSYCLGLWLDKSFMEHMCTKRGNCQYYVEDFFRRYGSMLDDFDMLICKENCEYYIPREIYEVPETKNEETDIFNL